MLITEFHRLEDVEKKDKLITSDNLYNERDRTLLYGYTCDRKTFHVYLKYNEIHTITYNTNYLTMTPENLEEIEVKDNFDYVPDKRLYPETCDYEFCKLLKKAGVHLPFTSFNNDREEKDFYGFTL